MSNPKGSKSARTPKPEPTLVEARCAHDGCTETTTMPFTKAAKGTTPAESGKPKVALDNDTVAVMLSPVDAPPPARTARKRKPEPTVANKAEVPEFAKRAAARNTPAEMAAVPEAVPSPEVPVPKKGRPSKPPEPKAAKGPPATPAAIPGSLRAIGAAWIDTLRADGHSVSTVSSYNNDLELAYEFLGGDAAATGISPKQIASFEASKAVVRKRNGKPRAQPTILKTRRVLRLALTWAEQQGLIKKAPYSAT